MKRIAQLLATAALLGACGGEPTATKSPALVRPQAAAAAYAHEHDDLAALRRVTAPFHDFANAKVAGWSAEITGCMADAAKGGMGFHYGNPALIDGTARVDEPELLLYEPQQDGRLRLVAVEYIIPYAARSRAAAPPVLFGREFSRNDVFELWGLHVWVWQDNPSGLYADWNPRVTCRHTTDVAVMSHD